MKRVGISILLGARRPAPWCALVLVLILGLGANSDAAATPAPGQEGSLTTLGFMVGSWAGEAFGGRIEEHWTGPSGGSMVGMFRLVVEGRARVIELFTVVREDERIVYRFNHFDPDLRRWEEAPLTYVLVETGEHRATFEMADRNDRVPRQLVYERIDDTTLRVALVGWPDDTDAVETDHLVLRSASLR